MHRLAVAAGPGFLRGDGDAFIDGGGIVGANLGADAVFERRDDFAAGGVVLGIGAEDDGDVERQADGIALNLHVAFLHDVEQADLNFSREVGKFVDGEDAAIGAGQQAVVNGELARQFVAAAGGFDGIDVADQVGDGDVRRGEFFHVAVVGREIRNGSGVAEARDFFAAAAADGRVGIVANLAAGQIRHVRIEQRRQGAQDAAFGLAAQAEQNEIVPRENGIDDLRNNGVVVADDAGENAGVVVVTQTGDEVVAEFVFHAAGAQALFGKGAAAQFA